MTCTCRKHAVDERCPRHGTTLRESSRTDRDRTRITTSLRSGAGASGQNPGLDEPVAALAERRISPPRLTAGRERRSIHPHRDHQALLEWSRTCEHHGLTYEEWYEQKGNAA